MASRRTFLKQTSTFAAMLGAFGTRLIRSGTHQKTDFRNNRLIWIQALGGLDALSMVFPAGNGRLDNLRPDILTPQVRRECLPLDDQYCLHPALESIFPLYEKGKLAVVQGVGLPGVSSRHHLAVQQMRTADPAPGQDTRSFFEAYLDRPDFLSDARQAPVPIAMSSNSNAHQASSGLSTLAKRVADLPQVRSFTVSMPGWDTHVGQGGVSGTFATQCTLLAENISGFWQDLADLQENTIVVVTSEFGRTIRQNDFGGTDHGNATLMMILGNTGHGGQVVGTLPDFTDPGNSLPVSLPVTTDIREVWTMLLQNHFGISRFSGSLSAFRPGSSDVFSTRPV